MSVTIERQDPRVAGGAPERSLKQRMDALAEANRIRSARAQLKRDLKARRKTAEIVLLAPPELTRTMKVLDLLLAAPKYGRVKASHTLGKCAISPGKTLGALSDRQRRELVARMRRS
jgi:hypothetical protein